jgi:two-component system response regulator
MDGDMILLVEDNDDDRELAMLAFKRAKVPNTLATVADGEEALDYLLPAGASTNSMGALKLVLLDLKLPKIDGIEVLRRIRADARTRYLPVVILTSSLEQADLATCYRLGANSYLHKPVDFLDFAELAERIAGYWIACNEIPPPHAA